MADAPIGYWRMETATGYNEATAVNDTLVGTPTLIDTPRGKAWSVNQNVSINLTGTYQDFTSDNTFTVEAWIKRANSSAPSYPTIWRRDGNGRTALLRMRDSNASIGPSPGCLEVYLSNGTTSVNVYSPSRYDDDKWHHVVLVVNGTGTTGSKLYVDGVLTNTFNNPGTLNYNSAAGSSAIVAGGPDPANGEGWAGGIEEVALYGTALTPTQITNHYTAGQLNPNAVNIAPAMTLTLAGTTGNKVTGSMSGPPIALSLTAPNTVVKTGAYSTMSNDNQGNGGQYASTAYVDLAPYQTTDGQAFFKFPDFAEGAYPAKAELKLHIAPMNGTPLKFKIHSLTQPFTDSVQYPLEPGVAYDPNGIQVDMGALATDTYYFDITPIAQKWALGQQPNHGVVLVYDDLDALPSTQTLLRITDHNVSSPATKSELVYTLTDEPSIPVTITPLPIEMTLTAPDTIVRSDTTQTVPAMSMTLAGSQGSVAISGNITVTAQLIDLDLEFGQGSRSSTPDFTAKVTPMELYLQAMDANQYVSVDTVVTATAMEITLGGTDDSFVNLQTDRIVYSQAMQLTLKVPGGYMGGVEDRYRTYVPLTTDADDVWLKLNEAAGTIANDSLTNDDPTRYTDNGVYMGGVALASGGYRNRAAASFDGVDDYLLMTTEYPTGSFLDMDSTIEFSIQTTDLNGTIMRGGGNAPTPFGGSMYGGTADCEIRLVDGEIVIYTGSNYNISYRTRKFVADGEWHHVIFSIPSATMNAFDSFNISKTKPHFLMVDGIVEWQRFTAPLYGRSFLPSSFMARAVFSPIVSGNPADVANYTASEFVGGSLSDIVIRFSYAVSKNTAEKLYYEWSESLLIKPTPIELRLTAVDPARAKGNIKRMVALYGLPYSITSDNNVPQTRDGWGTYFSIFAGYHIENDGFWVPTLGGPMGIAGHVNHNTNPVAMVFLQVKPFRLEDFMVYPVSIAATPGSNGGAFSAPGMENGEFRDPITREYIDDKTGLPRFVDLDKDLREEITEFDAITTVNYPAPQPEDGGNTSADPLREPRQHNLGLTNQEWTSARDRLRDSILSAVYRGVSIWINEPHMAEHLGFIQAWDKHSLGDKYEFFGPGNIDPTGYTNERAYELDGENLNPIIGQQRNQWRNGVGVGQFVPTYQANAKRKIIALEPGLTDLPGYEKTDELSYQSDNHWAPHAQFRAYNVIDRMSGLRIGDEVQLAVSEAGSYTGNWPPFNGWSALVPRQWAISARPEGIVGKAISKEIDFYYKEYGQIRPNPYKDNVYTIVAERGTVVRGQAIGGRAFIEFMDPDTQKVKIPVDIHPEWWLGNSDGLQGEQVSYWSFDSRRYKEVIITYILEKLLTRNSGTTVVSVKSEERYVEIQDRELDYKPYISMNARGLNWIAETDTVATGDVRIYAPAMNLKVEGTTDNSVSRTRSATVTAEPMTLRLELIEAASIDNPDVTVRATPIDMQLELRGLGKVIKAEVMYLSLTAPDAVVTGSGDRITVYMDTEREITLFMKED